MFLAPIPDIFLDYPWDKENKMDKEKYYTNTYESSINSSDGVGQQRSSKNISEGLNKIKKLLSSISDMIPALHNKIADMIAKEGLDDEGKVSMDEILFTIENLRDVIENSSSSIKIAEKNILPIVEKDAASTTVENFDKKDSLKEILDEINKDTNTTGTIWDFKKLKEWREVSKHTNKNMKWK